MDLAGIEIESPVLTAAGPTSQSGGTLLKAAQGGAGALVAKTICTRRAVVKRPNIACVQQGSISRGVVNCETWSEIPWEQWIEKEYAVAESSGLDVIASIGYTAEELVFLGPRAEAAGASGIEFSTHYISKDPSTLKEVAKSLRESVSIPIFAKISPGTENVKEVAKAIEPFIDGIVAINTVGPVLAVDEKSGMPLLGERYGWLSGPPIKPMALRVVSEISEVFKKPIIGVGGVSNGIDAAEFLMCGASAVEVCTAALYWGPQIYRKIAKELEEFVKQGGYSSTEELIGSALRERSEMRNKPDIEKSCTACRICERSCPSSAITIEEKGKGKVSDACTRCGLCITLCPVRAVG
jgi:dihydroorotate dehydrogenase subfamily 1